jgi:hypothetical protein
METPRLEPEQRVALFWVLSVGAVCAFFGWWVPRMLRWLLTGGGSYRPSRHTVAPRGSKRLPRALAADFEEARRQAASPD